MDQQYLNKIWQETLSEIDEKSRSSPNNQFLMDTFKRIKRTDNPVIAEVIEHSIGRMPQLQIAIYTAALYTYLALEKHQNGLPKVESDVFNRINDSLNDPAIRNDYYECLEKRLQHENPRVIELLDAYSQEIIEEDYKLLIRNTTLLIYNLLETQIAENEKQDDKKEEQKKWLLNEKTKLYRKLNSQLTLEQREGGIYKFKDWKEELALCVLFGFYERAAEIKDEHKTKVNS